MRITKNELGLVLTKIVGKFFMNLLWKMAI